MIIRILEKIVAHICTGYNFEVPYTREIETGITAICQKLVDTRVIYKACDDGGLDLRKTSNSFNNPDEYENRAKDKRIKIEKTENNKTKADVSKLAEAKGWKLTKKVS